MQLLVGGLRGALPQICCMTAGKHGKGCQRHCCLRACRTSPLCADYAAGSLLGVTRTARAAPDSLKHVCKQRHVLHYPQVLARLRVSSPDGQWPAWCAHIVADTQFLDHQSCIVDLDSWPCHVVVHLLCSHLNSQQCASQHQLTGWESHSSELWAMRPA